MGCDLNGAYTHCERLVHGADRDRYIATLFAPADKRPHLYALYALSCEVAGVRDKVTDPMPGEIRMQWWMDALGGRPCGEASANPLVHAVHDTMSRFDLPVSTLTDMIDARIFDLYDDPMPTLGDLVGYAGETCSAVMQLAAVILNDGDPPSTADIAGHGGVACTMARVLWNLPQHIARGQLFIPLDLLEAHGVQPEDMFARRTTPQIRHALKAFHDAAADHVAAMGCYVDQIPHKVAPAFLQTALVQHFLAAHRKLSDPLNQQARLAQWRRQWVLLRAAHHAERVCCES